MTILQVIDTQHNLLLRRCLVQDIASIALAHYIVSHYSAWSYGEKIRQKRLELELTQVDLAKLLGVNEMRVVGWEKGWHLPCPK
jgi:DNA-binding XRE family transcriptional regulator